MHTGKKLMFCSRCKVARYCDKNCQISHWEAHKVECKKRVAAASILQPRTNDSVVAMGRSMVQSILAQNEAALARQAAVVYNMERVKRESENLPAPSYSMRDMLVLIDLNSVNVAEEGKGQEVKIDFKPFSDNLAKEGVGIPDAWFQDALSSPCTEGQRRAALAPFLNDLIGARQQWKLGNLILFVRLPGGSLAIYCMGRNQPPGSAPAEFFPDLEAAAAKVEEEIEGNRPSLDIEKVLASEEFWEPKKDECWEKTSNKCKQVRRYCTIM